MSDDAEPALQPDPEILEPGRRLLAATPSAEDHERLTVAELRARIRTARAPFNAGGPAMAAVEDTFLPGPHRPIPIRVLRPTPGARAPVTLFFPGGGFVVGDLDNHDRAMRELAAQTGGPVVGVGVAQAPEHPFPAAFDEAAASVVALARDGAGFGLDSARLALAGESAGAALALWACLDPAARASGAPAAALLYSGSFGLRDSASRRLYAGGTFGIGERQLAFYRKHHRPPEADAADPRLDLLSNPLGGLPPLFVAAAALDPVRDDSVALHWSVRAAGGASTFSLGAGLPHGYLLFVGEVAAAAAELRAGAAFLRRVLG